jgi:uncharacterized protein (DUF1330 family)
MNSNFVLVAALYIHPGRESEFEQFESAASAIMKRHGGSIARRIGVAPQAGQDLPHEIHVVAFPDPAAFNNFRTDPSLASLADLRTRAIRQTTVWQGADLPPYSERPAD